MFLNTSGAAQQVYPSHRFPIEAWRRIYPSLYRFFLTLGSRLGTDLCCQALTTIAIVLLCVLVPGFLKFFDLHELHIVDYCQLWERGITGAQKKSDHLKIPTFMGIYYYSQLKHMFIGYTVYKSERSGDDKIGFIAVENKIES